MAEEADAAKSAFLSTVSHELRTPLTSVLGFAKIIKKRLEDRIFPLVPTDDRKVAQTIQQVEDNLEGRRQRRRAAHQADRRRARPREDRGRQARMAHGARSPSATSSIARRPPRRRSSSRRACASIKDVAPDLPAITGDRDRLIQVVINLISNAVKFTDAGSITCRAERRGGELVVSVIDTGIGIAPADQPKVFERFKQVGDTLTDKPKGTGLGLPICRRSSSTTAAGSGWRAQLGKGSTFSFSLPMPAEQAAAAGDGADGARGADPPAARPGRRHDAAHGRAPAAHPRRGRRREHPRAAACRSSPRPAIASPLAANGREAIAESSAASGRTWSCST